MEVGLEVHPAVSSSTIQQVGGATAAPESATPRVRDGVLRLPNPFPLHHGGALRGAGLAWRLEGAAQNPLLIVLGGISACRRVFGGEGPQRGWWNEVVGPGQALDTDRFQVLGIDYLGGSGLSTRPEPDQPFPALSSHDQADALVALLDELQIPKVRAIVGASYGGMVALAFAERFPARVERLCVISAADQTHPMATAWRSVQREIMRLGLRAGCPRDGIVLARALAMATYRSREEFAARFRGEPRFEADQHPVFPVEDYLLSRGRAYADSYRPESFICLSESIDLHRVNAAAIRVPVDVVAVREDQLVPLTDLQAMAGRLPQATLHEISSLFGHDAFLKEAEQLRPILGRLLESAP
jgi:homoserine O-acetyltransferase